MASLTGIRKRRLLYRTDHTSAWRAENKGRDTELQEAGFSKAFLQNLHGEAQSNIVPLLRFVDVDFGSQRPDWYQEPVSQFLKVA